MGKYLAFYFFFNEVHNDFHKLTTVSTEKKCIFPEWINILIQILSFPIFIESHGLVLQAAWSDVEFKGCWIQCDISFC